MNYYRNRFRSNVVERCDGCVAHVVRGIIEAQDRVEECECTTSCEASLHQLLHPRSKDDLGPSNTTIPLMLYCKSTCQPYVGHGISRGYDNDKSFFECLKSPIFRAKKFIGESECCVKLELLLPIDANGELHVCSDSDVCSNFPADCPICDFLATGVCITVDLEQFMGVTCLDPIRPIPASEFLSPTKY